VILPRSCPSLSSDQSLCGLVVVFSSTNPFLIIYRRLAFRGSMTAKLLLLQVIAALQLISIAFAWSSECPGKINTCVTAISNTAFSKSKESLDACLSTCSNAYGDWLWPDNGYPWAAWTCSMAVSGLMCPFNPAERIVSDCSSVINLCTGAPVDISQFQGKQPDMQALQQQTDCSVLQSICPTCLAGSRDFPAACGPVCSLRC
jgi:hypothetical protein